MSEAAAAPRRRGGPQLIPRPPLVPPRAGAHPGTVGTPLAGGHHRRGCSGRPGRAAAPAAPRCRGSADRRAARSPPAGPPRSCAPSSTRRGARQAHVVLTRRSSQAAFPHQPGLLPWWSPRSPAKPPSTPPSARPERRSGSTRLGRGPRQAVELCARSPIRRRSCLSWARSRAARSCARIRPKWSGPSPSAGRAHRPRRLPGGSLGVPGRLGTSHALLRAVGDTVWGATAACCGSCWTWWSSRPSDRQRSTDTEPGSQPVPWCGMICPRCGTVAAGQSATCSRCGGKLGRGEGSRHQGGATGAPGPDPRGELAQRAAGIVPQVLARPKKPAPLQPQRPDRVGVPGRSRGPPDTPARRSAQAWPPPPAQWEPGPVGAPADPGGHAPGGSSLRAAATAGTGEHRPGRPWPRPGPAVTGPGPATPAPNPAPGSAPPRIRRPQQSPATGAPALPATSGEGARRSPPSRVPGSGPGLRAVRPVGWTDSDRGTSAGTHDQRGTPSNYLWQSLVCLFLFLPSAVVAIAVLHPGQPPGPGWRHDRRRAGQPAGPHLVPGHGRGVYRPLVLWIDGRGKRSVAADRPLGWLGHSDAHDDRGRAVWPK